MATTQDFIEFVCDQIDNGWDVEYKKMFGEYMVYVNRKPVLLVCNNSVFVKELECIRHLSNDWIKGVPYPGAKEHYVVDIDDNKLLNEAIKELEKVIQIPVKKKSKRSGSNWRV